MALVLGSLLMSGAPLCPVAFLGGAPCPGCGLTRAGLSLLRGDFRGAIELSPLSPIVIPFAVAFAVRGFWGYLRAQSSTPPRWVIRGALTIWAALAVVWALRFAGFFGGPVAVTSLWNR